MREIRQKEFTNSLLTNDHTILCVAPRTGKCKIVIDYLKELNFSRILIIHPLIPIKKSWQDDFIKWGFNSKNVEFSTTANLKNIHEEIYDVIICDEIHLLSLNQLQYLRFLIKNQKIKRCIGLTGTLSKKSEETIKDSTKLTVGVRYSIKQAVAEGVVTDYRITVVMTDLDNSERYLTPSKLNPKYKTTEHDYYIHLSQKIEQIKANYGNLGLLPIIRMSIFKNSIAKKKLTKMLVEKYKDERLLIFCGTTAIADSLDVPVYHSKSTENNLKDDFCKGKFKHLAVCKMLNNGVTVLPINRAIINSFDSNSETLAQQTNRLMNFEYDNKDKIAQLMIICTNTVTERKWLQSALEFFEPEKITYKKYEEL
jgi:superfamily II DNA or RNA helicase